MDWLTFITEILKAVAWPIVVIVTVIILRTPLGELLGLLRKVKFKEFEVEFAQKVKQLKMDAAAVLTKEPASTERDLVIGERIEEIASISPRAAVAEAWREVEVAIRKMFKMRGLSAKFTSRSTMQQVRSNLDSARWNLVSSLYDLRNKALHADERQVSEKEAVEYGRLAMRLANELLQPMNGT